MKKTIIASAIAAVVSAPAFADVNISGAVQIEAGEIRTGTAAATSQYITRSDIKFSGSEDMGNGMKAGFNITQTVDDAAVSANTDRFVTVSGDFGQLKAGTFESYIESTIGASAANDAGHDVSNEINDGETGTQNQIEFSMSPMAGLTVGYQAGDSADTVFASYSNGGLTVRVAQESGNGSRDVTAMSAEYKMDGLRARVVQLDDDNGDAPVWMGVDYTMGSNNIAVSTVNNTGASGAQDNDMTVSLSHALSKQTTVYIAHGSDDNASVNDETLVGIKHSF
jgi:predicted porin